MSEYVKKNELLHDLQNEHAMWKKSMEKDDGLKFAWGNAHAYERMFNRVERGAFDAPDGEVQRLRAALERIVTVYEECDCTAKDLYLIAVNEVGSKQPKVANEVHEVLSTTTEPTGPSISKTQIENIKKMFNDPAYNGIYRSGIFNVLEELGITIPGINAPEGGGNDA